MDEDDEKKKKRKKSGKKKRKKVLPKRIRRSSGGGGTSKRVYRPKISPIIINRRSHAIKEKNRPKPERRIQTGKVEIWTEPKQPKQKKVIRYEVDMDKLTRDFEKRNEENLKKLPDLIEEIIDKHLNGSEVQSEEHLGQEDIDDEASDGNLEVEIVKLVKEVEEGNEEAMDRLVEIIERDIEEHLDEIMRENEGLPREESEFIDDDVSDEQFEESEVIDEPELEDVDIDQDLDEEDSIGNENDIEEQAEEGLELSEDEDYHFDEPAFWDELEAELMEELGPEEEVPIEDGISE